MRIYASAYLAYGIKAGELSTVQENDLDAAIKQANKEFPGANLGHLQAGRFDKQEMYLVGETVGVEAGEFQTVELSGLASLGHHHTILAIGQVVENLEMDNKTAPAWMLICDVDN